ncbi:PREDICTED: lactadherin-like [Priapulus caudatus]|uniref:Lactadherin-like n=1 Tax=Priapulus caudatus TaxID=37621 RepID=A0ABM1E7A9_PRICU|nr:PREDICTED: lactadherin-like [Priapulus caudatus]
MKCTRDEIKFRGQTLVNWVRPRPVNPFFNALQSKRQFDSLTVGVIWTLLVPLLALLPGYTYSGTCDSSLGMTTGYIKDWQIAASSSSALELDKHSREKYARPYLPNGFAWCAGGNASSEWLLIDLGVMSKITGIVTQGKGDKKRWVTKYTVSHSLDAIQWRYCMDAYGQQKVFHGNTDSFSARHHYLQEAMLARFVKIHVKHFHVHPCMRVELMGCRGQQGTAEFCGAQTAPNHVAERMMRAWEAMHLNNGFPGPAFGKIIRDQQGKPDGKTTMKEDLTAMHDCTREHSKYARPRTVTQDNLIHICGSFSTFGGNSDKFLERRHYINEPFIARFIRLHPMQWMHHVSMRAGIIGCPHTGECVGNFMQVTQDTNCVENLAQKRRTWCNDKSKKYRRGRRFDRLALAVDGVLDTSLHMCAVLDNAYVQYPRFMIDLGRKHTVHGIVITTWQGMGQDADHRFSDYLLNLEKIAVYVETHRKLTRMRDEQRCAEINRTSNAVFAPRLLLECGTPTRGRYVYLEGHGTTNRWSLRFFLVLCEIQVY